MTLAKNSYKKHGSWKYASLAFFVEVGNMQQKATNNIPKKPPITKPKLVIERNNNTAHMSLFSSTHQTRANIEAKVRAHVETFIVQNSCELFTPPPKVKM
jgi:hypothetical protein